MAISQRDLTALILASGDVKRLQRCLTSLESLGCHVVIGFDRGDNPHDLLETSLTTEVVPIDWTGRFDHALNTLLDSCTSKWILRIDEDMWLDRLSADVIAHAVTLDEESAYELISADYLGDDVYYSQMLRLWRHHDERYEGRVHERLYPIMEADSHVPALRATLHHDGYREIYAIRPKLQRNLALLEQDWEDRPDSYVEAYLILTRADLREPGWLPHLLDVLQQQRAKPSSASFSKGVDLLALFLETDAKNVADSVLFDWVIDLILNRYPKHPRLLYDLAHALAQRDKRQQAVDVLWKLAMCLSPSGPCWDQWFSPRIIEDAGALYRAIKGESALNAMAFNYITHSMVRVPPLRPDQDYVLEGSRLFILRDTFARLGMVAEQADPTLINAYERAYFARRLELPEEDIRWYALIGDTSNAETTARFLRALATESPKLDLHSQALIEVLGQFIGNGGFRIRGTVPYLYLTRGC